VSATVVGAMANRLGFQRLKLKLGWSTFTAARPQARPLAFARRCWLSTTFTTRIVYASSKSAWEGN